MDILLLAGVIVFVACAVLLRDMLKAAICLMMSSIIMGIIFFRLHAPYAGVFEISVIAGLVMVLFIMTISLVGGDADVKEPHVPFAVFIFLFLAFSLIVGSNISSLPISQGRVISSVPMNVGEVLWIQRAFDIVGQVSVIFAGVFVLLAVVGARRKNGK